MRITDIRGASETIGFVFVFSIIVATIGAVYFTGFNALDDSKDAEQLNNAERAFEVLRDNMEDMTKRNAPSRATEIKLADATLGPGEPVWINVSVADPGEASPDLTYATELSPIVYTGATRAARGGQDIDDASIVYAGGATFRQQGDAAVMRRDAPFVLNEDGPTSIPVVQTRRGEGANEVSGSTTLLVRGDLSNKQVVQRNTTETKVWINVSSSRYKAWETYLEAQGEGMSSFSCTTTAATETVSCSFTTDEVYVTRIAIDYVFEE